MICPHCHVAYHYEEDESRSADIGSDKDGTWEARWAVCPECEGLTFLLKRHYFADARGLPFRTEVTLQVYPQSTGRPPCPHQVPRELAEDYREACKVVAVSPKAAAALSRRCLQHLLREHAKVKPQDLYKEIQELLDRGILPSHIAEALDAVRIIGNLAAHPEKSKATGEIVPVETGEAEWTLDVLEALFDFYFVQPAILANKKAALNKKLQEAGKPRMK